MKQCRKYAVIVDADSSDVAQLRWSAELVLPSDSLFRNITNVCLEPETGTDSPHCGVDFWTGMEWAPGGDNHLGYYRLCDGNSLLS